MKRMVGSIVAGALAAAALVGCGTSKPAAPSVAASKLSPHVEALSNAMKGVAPNIPFPVFYPTYIPTGYRVAGAPSWNPQIGLETGFAGADGKADLTLMQRSPTPVLLESMRENARQVPVGANTAWARDLQKAPTWSTPSSLSFLRDGTWVHLDSFALPVSELVRVAASLQPVPGGHGPVAVPGVDDLTTIRRKAAFAVFVPLRLPQGLTYSLLPEESSPGTVVRLGIAFRNQFDQRILSPASGGSRTPPPWPWRRKATTPCPEPPCWPSPAPYRPGPSRTQQRQMCLPRSLPNNPCRPAMGPSPERATALSAAPAGAAPAPAPAAPG